MPHHWASTMIYNLSLFKCLMMMILKIHVKVISMTSQLGNFFHFQELETKGYSVSSAGVFSWDSERMPKSCLFADFLQTLQHQLLFGTSSWDVNCHCCKHKDLWKGHKFYLWSQITQMSHLWPFILLIMWSDLILNIILGQPQ